MQMRMTVISMILAAALLQPVAAIGAEQSAAAGQSAARLPDGLRPLFDFPVRDTCVCLVDGVYYLTGTTGAPTWWKTNEGIRIWKSTDLKKWEPLGLVWSIEKDGTWQKPIKDGHRAIWAPELHYIKGTFWLAYCINWPGGGTGILKSTTGKAEGPYVDVKPDGPLTSEIDASLFQDDDGKVYFVYQDGKIARLKDDLSGLAEKPRLLKPANADHVGFEAAFVFKVDGRYYLSCAEFINEEYHCMIAGADSLAGPWSDRYLAIPHGGHNMFFKDKDGRWWSTFFGNDKNAPFNEKPGILRIEFDKAGKIRPLL
jgi:xylan 1,4-beta-xylosidase